MTIMARIFTNNVLNISLDGCNVYDVKMSWLKKICLFERCFLGKYSLCSTVQKNIVN